MKLSGISKLKPMPANVTKAIRGCVSIGSGDISNLRVNGKLVKEIIEWKDYCILDPLYGGIICDGEIVVRFNTDDTWSVDVMHNHNIVVNSIDASLIENLEKATKQLKRSHKK